MYHCNFEVLYGVFGTDGMFHDWYLKSCFLSASQGMVGNNNVSLHNSGVELCLPTIWVLHVYLHNYLRFQKNEFPPISCFQACIN